MTPDEILVDHRPPEVIFLNSVAHIKIKSFQSNIDSWSFLGMGIWSCLPMTAWYNATRLLKHFFFPVLLDLSTISATPWTASTVERFFLDPYFFQAMHIAFCCHPSLQPSIFHSLSSSKSAYIFSYLFWLPWFFNKKYPSYLPRCGEHSYLHATDTEWVPNEFFSPENPRWKSILF